MVRPGLRVRWQWGAVDEKGLVLGTDLVGAPPLEQLCYHEQNRSCFISGTSANSCSENEGVVSQIPMLRGRKFES